MRRELHDELADRLIAEGKLIAAGFHLFRQAVIPPNAPQVQVDEMRNAWFAGAQHLYGSIMGVLEEGEEPTDADMLRMASISGELAAYAKELALRVAPTHGTAQ